MVMKMAVEYDCVHEDLIQNQSRDIERLKTRQELKEKRIDDLYEKIEKMEEKIDKMNDNINELILKSTQGDTNLELRLKTIETELHLMKQQQEKDREDSQKRLTNYIAIMGLLLTGLIFIINYFFK